MNHTLVTKDQLHLVPDVEWQACAKLLPQEGKFVWILVGRIIEFGTARRYERQVHMGIYKGESGFDIHPFGPLCSDQVWAWAQIVRPEPPLCRSNPPPAGNDAIGQ